MKSIMIQDINEYSDEEIRVIIRQLDDVLHERKRAELKAVEKNMEASLRKYFQANEATDIVIDDNYYGIDNLLYALKNNIC